MDAATISRLMDLIPERVAHAQTGTLFTPEQAGTCRWPERLALIMGKLDWMTPLTYLTKDEQRELGLLSATGRLMHAGDQEEEDVPAEDLMEGEAEDVQEEDLAEDDLALDEEARSPIPAMVREEEPVEVSTRY